MRDVQGASKELPLVVSFKLDNHISGAISNAIQIIVGQNQWDIWNCVGAKKSAKIKVCPVKTSFEMALGSAVIA